jgi:hypothetical protein
LNLIEVVVANTATDPCEDAMRCQQIMALDELTRAFPGNNDGDATFRAGVKENERDRLRAIRPVASAAAMFKARSWSSKGSADIFYWSGKIGLPASSSWVRGKSKLQPFVCCKVHDVSV